MSIYPLLLLVYEGKEWHTFMWMEETRLLIFFNSIMLSIFIFNVWTLISFIQDLKFFCEAAL